MTNEPNSNRLKKIYQMLFEMATGNMTFRINDDGSDGISNITAELNALADELQEILIASDYVNPYYSYQNLIQLIFVLNENFILVSFNDAVPITLKYKSTTIRSTDFGKLIAQQSKQIWDTTIQELEANKVFQATLQLIFITGDNLLLPSFCTVSKLSYSDKIIVSSVSTILDEMLDFNNRLSDKKIRKQINSTAIQNVHRYILTHLDEPLPTLPELVKMFGSEEHILRNGFKEFYNCSMYNFYHVARLKKSHDLIIQTSLPLKHVALMCGFASYLNFYKAFKKNFNYSPSDLSRPDSTSED